MGATYTRQSSSGIVDGGVIEATDLNNEFDQLLAAFAVSSGHSHDGTAAEGGPITKLLGTAITIGDATSGTDIAVTFDGETNDGVLTWMEDEDYFQFSDDLLLSTTEKLQFRDTAIYINSSTDGQLDLVADTEIQIAATTIDINGAVALNGAITGATNITLSGELDAATLDISGNADIDGTLETDALSINGTAVTSTAAELNLVDGITAGTVSASLAVITDSNKDISGFRNVTLTGELDAATLDISGNADIDGTLEADAITIDGVTLAETIADTVGAMVTSNTESGITVAYQDADNTLDFTIGTLNQDTTGTAAIATTVTITDNESTNENNALIFTAGGDVDGGNLGLESDGTLTYNPSTGKVTATGFVGTLEGNVTGNVTGNTSGTAATVTGAAQSNITSLGTLTTLTVDNVIVNGSTIGHTGDTDLMTVASGVLTVAGEVDATSLDISGDADIDGTLEADAITVDGVALATFVRDTVGTNMLSSNTESGITVTYDTSNDNIDFAIDAAQTGITSLLATDIKIGEDDQTKIDFETADTINCDAGNEKQVILKNCTLTTGTNAIFYVGTDDYEGKD